MKYPSQAVTIWRAAFLGSGVDARSQDNTREPSGGHSPLRELTQRRCDGLAEPCEALPPKAGFSLNSRHRLHQAPNTTYSTSHGQDRKVFWQICSNKKSTSSNTNLSKRKKVQSTLEAEGGAVRKTPVFHSRAHVHGGGSSSGQAGDQVPSCMAGTADIGQERAVVFSQNPFDWKRPPRDQWLQR